MPARLRHSGGTPVPRSPQETFLRPATTRIALSRGRSLRSALRLDLPPTEPSGHDVADDVLGIASHTSQEARDVRHLEHPSILEGRVPVAHADGSRHSFDPRRSEVLPPHPGQRDSAGRA